jgi:hypothetical protein
VFMVVWVMTKGKRGASHTLGDSLAVMRPCHRQSLRVAVCGLRCTQVQCLDSSGLYKLLHLEACGVPSTSQQLYSDGCRVSCDGVCSAAC